VNQISGTTPTNASEQAQDDSQAANSAAPGERSQIGEGGFGSRGRARRRARFLRKARELAYRDLGGLVFNLHRFGQRNDALVLAKLTTLGHIDAELRTIEAALREREPVTVLREAGITACPRCAAIHSSEDRFCPNCGLSMSRHVDLPVAGAAAIPAPAAAAPQPQAQAAPATASHPAPTSPSQSAPLPAGATPVPKPATPVPEPPAQSPFAQPTPPGAATAPPPLTTPPPLGNAHAPIPAHQPSPPAGGRSPNPPSSGEEATEIIRPGAPGS